MKSYLPLLLGVISVLGLIVLAGIQTTGISRPHEILDGMWLAYATQSINVVVLLITPSLRSRVILLIVLGLSAIATFEYLLSSVMLAAWAGIDVFSLWVGFCCLLGTVGAVLCLSLSFEQKDQPEAAGPLNRRELQLRNSKIVIWLGGVIIAWMVFAFAFNQIWMRKVEGNPTDNWGSRFFH